MPQSLINIDFDLLRIAFRKYVREKAMLAGSTIVYREGAFLIEENPKTLEKKILKEYSHKAK